MRQASRVLRGPYGRAGLGVARKARIRHTISAPAGRRVISDPPLLVPIDELLPVETDRTAFESQLKDLIAKYRRTLETNCRFLLEQFEFIDMGRKVVGVGSVGTRCWIIMMLGRDDSHPLFLQVKEAERSILAAFIGASKYTNRASA